VLPQRSSPVPAAPATAPEGAPRYPRQVGLGARAGRLLVLALTDFAALLLAGALAYLLWARPVRDQSPELYLGLAPLLSLFLLGYAQAGLYPGFGLGPVEILRRVSLVTLTGYLVLASFSFAFKLPYLFSRVTFALALALSLLLVPVLRFAVLTLAARRLRWWPEPVVLVGDPASAQRALAALAGADAMGYRPVGWLGPEGRAPAAGTAGGDDLPRLGGLDDAPALADRGLRVALLAVEPGEGRVLDRLQASFERVVMLRGYGELPVEGLQVRNLGGVLGIEVTNNLLQVHNRWIKRTLDLVVGGVGLLLALPVIAVGVLAVKLASRGPAFFHQERVGLYGVPFRMPKLRTMHVDAEERLERHLARDPEMAREWGERMKLSRDPRLVRGVGRLLRRFSLDELPQLWSVVTGEMSLVGPRPFPGYHVERFQPAFRTLRQRVRPGLTGLWQVTARSDGDLATQEAYDSYYIRNGSLWLDLYVLARTLGAVLSGRGAY
jgi:Undecaprenyl-phosphate galactose phosphotransferase WbaP